MLTVLQSWRKILALALALIILSAVPGCSGNPPAEENPEHEAPTYTQEEMEAPQDEMREAEIDPLTAMNESFKTELKTSAAKGEDTGIPILDTVVPVSAPAGNITAIAFNKSTDLSLSVGYTNRRTATTTPAGGIVTYTSSNTTVAMVDTAGNVTCKAAGKTVITATSGGQSASYNLTVLAETATSSSSPTAPVSAYGVFAGYTVTVLDKTTPAVTIMGRTTDRNVMCFLSANDKEVGTISLSDYNAIVQKNRRVVNLPGGGTYGTPPVDGKSWEEWFADEFNEHRGLGVGSREEATSTDRAETIEKYRQEVIRLTNIERENAGLAPLDVNEDAMAFAQIRAQEVVSNYSHTRPNGEPLRVNGDIVNENVGAKSTPETQVRSWMNSEGHHGNILNLDAYAIGVGVYQTDSGAFYWVQIFMW